ncbi:MAG: methyltransferase [Oscillospiraceae bacterium]|nr:methyltransferase [Oscillospiraceae bacterium]
MTEKLLKDERLEPLGGGMHIVVSDDHPFGTDAILLADFASIRRGDTVCDLGTGCGIIPLIWCKNGLAAGIDAVDIQEKACGQLRKSAEINGVSDKLRVYHADLRDLKGILRFGAYDAVTINPPYKPVGTGIESVSESEKIARHETCCTLEDAVAAAKKLLRFGGRFCLCHRPERLCDIMVSMRNGGIEPKRIRFVVQERGKAPWLVLVEGRSGGKPHLTVEPELSIKSPDGSDSEELLRIFGNYREGHEI